MEKLNYLKYSLQLIWTHWSETKESYSQHGEDILVSHILGQVDSFVEIGANDGVLFSNCYKFSKKGAKGLCLEPSSKCFWKLWLNHLFHPEVKCINVAISCTSRELFLEDKGYESVLSSVQTGYKEGLKKVKGVSLLDLWAKYPSFKNADLLSIDVEGHEFEVLEGAGSEPLSYKVIILESDKLNEEELLRLPSLQNHLVCFSNAINLILIHKDYPSTKTLDIPAGFIRRSR